MYLSLASVIKNSQLILFHLYRLYYFEANSDIKSLNTSVCTLTLKVFLTNLYFTSAIICLAGITDFHYKILIMLNQMSALVKIIVT